MTADMTDQLQPSETDGKLDITRDAFLGGKVYVHQPKHDRHARGT